MEHPVMDDLPGAGRIRNVTPEMRVIAQRLRREMTRAEHILWSALSGKKLEGLRFRRQHAVGTFCFDFFCPAHGVVIELDGSVHDLLDVAERDRLRRERIEHFGYRVLRFHNEEVEENLPLVLDKIRMLCQKSDIVP